MSRSGAREALNALAVQPMPSTRTSRSNAVKMATMCGVLRKTLGLRFDDPDGAFETPADLNANDQ
jgi:hypothetical protein